MKTGVENIGNVRYFCHAFTHPSCKCTSRSQGLLVQYRWC